MLLIRNVKEGSKDCLTLRKKEFKSCGKIEAHETFSLSPVKKKWQNNLFICWLVREPDAKKNMKILII
jgi:hypothetical protein